MRDTYTDYFVGEADEDSSDSNSRLVIDDHIIQSAYRTYSESFMHECIDIFTSALALTKFYPSLQFFPKRLTQGLWYMPDRPPDGYILLQAAGKQAQNKVRANTFYLDILPAKAQRQELRERYAGYNDLFESHVLQDDHLGLPVLLLICRSVELERKARKQMHRHFEESYYQTECFSTTLDKLTSLTGDNSNPAIWTDAKDPEHVYALNNLPEGRRYSF